jgi:hypothetical protein
MTARAYRRIVVLPRPIDPDGSDLIQTVHLVEAIHYRRLGSSDLPRLGITPKVRSIDLRLPR